MGNFDTEKYWQERLAKDYSLTGVGDIGLSLKQNELIYNVRHRMFNKILAKHINTQKTENAIDLGSGTGFYVQALKQHKVNLTDGVDLTEIAVANLNENFPEIHFQQGDITLPTFVSKFSETFDLITCMDVLFHIVDNEKYVSALRNLSNLLSDNGTLIISQNLLKRKEKGLHQVSRTEEEILSHLRAANLNVKKIYPMTHFSNDPVRKRTFFNRKVFSLYQNVFNNNRSNYSFLEKFLSWVEIQIVLKSKRGISTEFLVLTKTKAL